MGIAFFHPIFGNSQIFGNSGNGNEIRGNGNSHDWHISGSLYLSFNPEKLCYKCAKLDYGGQCKDTVGYRDSLK